MRKKAGLLASTVLGAFLAVSTVNASAATYSAGETAPPESTVAAETLTNKFNQYAHPKALTYSELEEKTGIDFSGPLRDPENHPHTILIGDFTDGAGQDYINELEALSEEDPNADIFLVIRSKGGSVMDGFQLLETMHKIPNRVHTICDTHACSIAAVVFSGNQAGYRITLPTSRVMLHEGSFNMLRGPESRIRNAVEQLEDSRDVMKNILANATGIDPKTVDAFLSDDIWLNSTEAADLNFSDAIIEWEPKVDRTFNPRIPEKWKEGSTSREMREVLNQQPDLGS